MNSQRLAHYFYIFLIAVHVGLASWALLGFAELLLSHVPWKRLSNPLFSDLMLVVQWSEILIAAAIFIWGYFARWKHTPKAMLYPGCQHLECRTQQTKFFHCLDVALSFFGP